MKQKSISDAGSGRLGRLLKDVWFVLLSRGAAPDGKEMKVICELNGVSYYEVCRLFASFNGWKEGGNCNETV